MNNGSWQVNLERCPVTDLKTARIKLERVNLESWNQGRQTFNLAKTSTKNGNHLEAYGELCSSIASLQAIFEAIDVSIGEFPGFSKLEEDYHDMLNRKSVIENHFEDEKSICTFSFLEVSRYQKYN